jgi:hypothetical protein
MKLLIFVFLFFVLGALLIISNYELSFYEEGNAEKFSEHYVNWLDGIYSNFQSVTGYVVEMDWMPKTKSLNSGFD